MELDVYKEWLGIPEGPRPPDHYTLLRLVQFEDDAEKVRAHYRKLNSHVRKYATGQYSVRSQELLNELAKGMLCLTDPERKREYDESLGREFPEEAGMAVPMQRVLVKQGHITREQMKQAEEFADQRGLSMRDAVVQMRLVDQQIATQALAAELKLPYVDLDDMAPDDSVLDQVPKSTCSRNSVLPLFIDGNVLLVACVDELTHHCEDELRLRFGVAIRRVLVTPTAMNQSIAKYYAPGLRDDAGSKSVRTEPAKPAKKDKKQKAEAAEVRPAPKKASPDRRKRFSELDAGEQAQRKQLGWIMMLWGFIGAVVFDQMVVKAFVPFLNFGGLLGYLPSITTFIVVPTVVFYVTKVYWK